MYVYCHFSYCAPLTAFFGQPPCQAAVQVPQPSLLWAEQTQIPPLSTQNKHYTVQHPGDPPLNPLQFISLFLELRKLDSSTVSSHMEAFNLLFPVLKQQATSCAPGYGLKVCFERGGSPVCTVHYKNNLFYAARQPLMPRILYAVHMLGLNNVDGFESVFWARRNSPLSWRLLSNSIKVTNPSLCWCPRTGMLSWTIWEIVDEMTEKLYSFLYWPSSANGKPFGTQGKVNNLPLQILSILALPCLGAFWAGGCFSVLVLNTAWQTSHPWISLLNFNICILGIQIILC